MIEVTMTVEHYPTVGNYIACGEGKFSKLVADGSTEEQAIETLLRLIESKLAYEYFKNSHSVELDSHVKNKKTFRKTLHLEMA
ncbi:MAG: hypothetical protein HOP11_02480 [Saprospiraceae bacterium]|nr:hypothetical protein [Saprospiraceae bacterium]